MTLDRPATVFRPAAPPATDVRRSPSPPSPPKFDHRHTGYRASRREPEPELRLTFGLLDSLAKQRAKL